LAYPTVNQLGQSLLYYAKTRNTQVDNQSRMTLPVTKECVQNSRHNCLRQITALARAPSPTVQILCEWPTPDRQYLYFNATDNLIGIRVTLAPKSERVPVTPRALRTGPRPFGDMKNSCLIDTSSHHHRRALPPLCSRRPARPRVVTPQL